MRLQNAYDAYGEYNLVLHNVDESIYRWVDNNYGKNLSIGLEKIIDSSIAGFTIVACDDKALDMNHYELLEGSLPNNESEIAISATAKYKGKFIISSQKVGNTITVNSKEYVISGIINDFDYSTIDTYKFALVSNNIESNKYNIYIHCKNKESYTELLDGIKLYFNVSDDRVFLGDKSDGFLFGKKLSLIMI